MKGRLSDKQRLLHILESIAEIEKYTSHVSLDSFMENSMMRYASIKQIEIIGEAANQISTDTKNRFSDIQWRQIVGLRNVLVHEYFGVDNQLVWQIIVHDIPNLKVAVQAILLEINHDNTP